MILRNPKLAVSSDSRSAGKIREVISSNAKLAIRHGVYRRGSFPGESSPRRPLAKGAGGENGARGKSMVARGKNQGVQR